jgi:hypothetical protein
MFGGLERLNVHFSKPVYLIELITEHDRDIPFGWHDESRGFYKNYGWTAAHNALPSLSVGKWLGYCEEDNPEKELTVFIWQKLCEHFLNEDFLKWEELESAGKVKIEDFLLEIDLDVRIRTQTPGNQTT